MEAAKKAGDVKAKALAKATGAFQENKREEVLEGSGKKDLDDEAKKSGSVDPDAEAVVEGSKETLPIRDGRKGSDLEDVNSRKNRVTTESEGNEPQDPDAEAVVPGSKDTIETKEDKLEPDRTVKIPEALESKMESEVKGKGPAVDVSKATSATGDAQDLPGKKTQEQAAASGEDAGASVAD